jgi:hypothetical protein
MKIRNLFLAIALLALSSCDSDSQCELRLKSLQETRDNGWVIIDPGYLTASEYFQLDEQAQQYYLDGIIDGIRLGPLFGVYDQSYTDARLKTFIYCVRSWDDERKTIVDHHLRALPVKHHDGHSTFFAALMEACNDLIESCQNTTCKGIAKM